MHGLRMQRRQYLGVSKSIRTTLTDPVRPRISGTRQASSAENLTAFQTDCGLDDAMRRLSRLHRSRQLSANARPTATNSRSDMQTFGAVIYAIRCRSGWTQASVAAKARLSNGYYSELENGKRPAPPTATARRVAQALVSTSTEIEQLVALAHAERSATLHDSHLPPAVRELVAAIRASATNLPAEVVLRMQATLAEARM